MSTKTVCVVGVGSSGLVAIKSCVESGFDCVCYEKSQNIGGLWRFSSTEMSTVTKSTVMNTSKEISAFSDFPPPVEYPIYMNNSQALQYLEAYAKTYNLTKYIKYRHFIEKIIPCYNYEETGQWNVTVVNMETNVTVERIFDGVMVCTGHHSIPNLPHYDRQDSFNGDIIHSCCYKETLGFENKNVVVVGAGNSGCDIAVELSHVAKTVYLSTRSGFWLRPKVSFFGLPASSIFQRRVCRFVLSLLSRNIVNKIFEFVSNLNIDHDRYRIKPKDRILDRKIVMSDELPSRIGCGQVIVKSDIEQFADNGVVFKGERDETKCDAVVFATGYNIEFKFIHESMFGITDKQIRLFKHVFIPQDRHSQTLAFIGITQPTGPFFPVAETQCRWFVELMKGSISLPSKEDMVADMDASQRATSRKLATNDYATTQINFMQYMDDIAEKYGAKPNLTKLFFSNFRLWLAVFFGPFASYQYRLDGPHKWSKAKETLLGLEKRIDSSFHTNQAYDSWHCK